MCFAEIGMAVAGKAATTATTTMVGIQTVLAAVGQALSIKSQKEQFDLATASQEQEADAANRSFNLQNTAARLKENQEALASAQEVQKILKKGDKAIATAMVSAGESGVENAKATSAVIADLERQEADALFALQTQDEFRGVASWLGDENRSFAHTQTLVDINKPRTEPDYLGSLTNLTGDIFKIRKDDMRYEQEERRIKALGTA